MLVQNNFPLKKISWIKIGGIARKYYEIIDYSEFRKTVQNLVLDGVQFEVLGWGANSLISDNGLDSIVIKNKSSFIEINSEIDEVNEGVASQEIDFVKLSSRHAIDKEKGSFYGMEYEDIDYEEQNASNITVRIAAGVGLPYAINYLIEHGVTGLQLFSGIPGTVGASVFNNIHGGPRLFSEYINSVEVIDNKGKFQIYRANELTFGYNSSSLQTNRDIVLAVNLNLKLGDKEKARFAAIEWAKRKRVQPKNSLGSVFHNLETADVERLGLPVASTAYLIDKHLNELVGMRIGDIMIPVDTNKNIFVNLGNGTASDFLALMKKVYYAALEKYDIRLKSEIFFKGFDTEEIKEFLTI